VIGSTATTKPEGTTTDLAPDSGGAPYRSTLTFVAPPTPPPGSPGSPGSPGTPGTPGTAPGRGTIAGLTISKTKLVLRFNTPLRARVEARIAGGGRTVVSRTLTVKRGTTSVTLRLKRTVLRRFKKRTVKAKLTLRITPQGAAEYSIPYRVSRNVRLKTR